jgi:hypothetical protein
MKKTQSKNLKYYRHFYKFDDPDLIDTKKLAKKLRVSQQKLAGLLRAAKNNPEITTALKKRGEKPPRWFAEQEHPQDAETVSHRSNTAEPAQQTNYNAQITRNSPPMGYTDPWPRNFRSTPFSYRSTLPQRHHTIEYYQDPISQRWRPIEPSEPTVSPYQLKIENLASQIHISSLQDLLDSIEQKTLERRERRERLNNQRYFQQAANQQEMANLNQRNNSLLTTNLFLVNYIKNNIKPRSPLITEPVNKTLEPQKKRPRSMADFYYEASARSMGAKVLRNDQGEFITYVQDFTRIHKNQSKYIESSLPFFNARARATTEKSH